MKKIDNRFLTVFFENMAFLLDAGIDPLTSAITLADTKNKQSKLLADIISRELKGGHDLSEAFERNRKSFGTNNYAAYISAGIKSGNLSEVLLRLSDSISSSQGIKKQVYSAMAYPILLFLITIAASIYMFSSVVPQMAANMQELNGGNLPAFTKAVLGFSNFLAENKVTLLIATIIAVIVIRMLIVTFATKIDKVMTRLPLIGKILVSVDLIEYYSNFANLIDAGIPTSEALAVCIPGIKNRYIKNQITKQAAMHNEHGQPYGESVAKLDFVPDTEKQCLLIADKTGNLPAMLSKIATKRQVDIKQDTKSLLTFVEPAMMLIMGGIIGTVVIAVYMPMLAMTNF